MALPIVDQPKLLEALDHVSAMFPGYGVILTVVGPDDGDTASTMAIPDLVCVLQGIINDATLGEEVETFMQRRIAERLKKAKHGP